MLLTERRAVPAERRKWSCYQVGMIERLNDRIFVARAARRLPALIEALRSGKVHLGGLRLLAPLLTVENHLDVLARAAGKSKRQIEEIVARLAPKPPVAAAIRKLPEQTALPIAAAAR